MRRTDLFLAFRHKHQIDRQLLARSADGMERGQECRFGSFLIDGPAADDDLAEAWLIHKFRFEWWRRPLGGIYLLYVIRKVKAQRLRRARVQRGEDPGLPIGRY